MRSAVLGLVSLVSPLALASESPLEEAQALRKVYILTCGFSSPTLFSIEDPVCNRDNCLDVFYQLKEKAAERGYVLEQITTADSIGECEYCVMFDIYPDQIPLLEQIPKEKRILFLWEPPSTTPNNDRVDIHDYFSKIYTWNDALVDDQKYFKFYYPVLLPMIESPIDFSMKQFCNLIASNRYSYHPNQLYSERYKVIRFFEAFAPDDFDLYGIRWPSSEFPSYRGSIVRKVDVMKWYKFSFTYENIQGIPGYVTEKIFDAFHAGSVPIYWGASNIDAYIPKNCFIARQDFESEKDLYEALVNMTEEEHALYLQNIRTFISSEQAQLYSKENFIRIFMELIEVKK